MESKRSPPDAMPISSQGIRILQVCSYDDNAGPARCISRATWRATKHVLLKQKWRHAGVQSAHLREYVRVLVAANDERRIDPQWLGEVLMQCSFQAVGLNRVSRIETPDLTCQQLNPSSDGKMIHGQSCLTSD
jgi:hypothetical protein